MLLSRLHGPGWREAIDQAHKIIGADSMRHLGHVQTVCGVDPVFAGVHPFELADDGRSYRDTACCVYPFHIAAPADRRVTTVVVPTFTGNHWSTVATIVHEYGHALHEVAGFEYRAHPVSEYARTNNWEAFAEAFSAWCWPGMPGYERRHDRDAALFRHMAKP